MTDCSSPWLKKDPTCLAPFKNDSKSSLYHIWIIYVFSQFPLFWISICNEILDLFPFSGINVPYCLDVLYTEVNLIVFDLPRGPNQLFFNDHYTKS